MEMKKIKDVQELLMDAMTNYVIAEKAGDHNGLAFYLGVVHTYFTVMGAFSRLSSPWESLWGNVCYWYLPIRRPIGVTGRK